MPKATTPTAERRGHRHNPLENDILATGPLRLKPSKTKKTAETESQQYVDSKQSKNILRMSRQLVADEDDDKDVAVAETGPNVFGLESREDFGDEEADEAEDTYGQDDEDGVPEEDEVAPEDLGVFNGLLQPDGDDPLLRHGWGGQSNRAEEPAPGRNIADLIMQALARKEAQDERAQMREKGIAPPDEEEEELSEKVVEVFTQYVPHR